MWFDADTMSAYHPHPLPEESSRLELKRALAATAILIALFALLMFAPPPDAAKVVAGVPCSVLSEDDISAVLGTHMRLMPTSGTVCQYVSTGAGTSRTLFVIARHDAPIPESVSRNGVAVTGIGDAAVRSANTVYARYGHRSYTFYITPESQDPEARVADELGLAKKVQPALVARNR